MTKEEQIRDGLAGIAKRHGPLQTLLCKVVSVDEAEFTCVVDEDGFEMNDVRLRPVLNGKESITIVPKVNSWVLITRLEDDDEWMVIAVDEIEKYRIVNGTMLFEMKNGKYLVKSGADTLKEVLQNIIEAVQQVMVIYGNNPNYAKLTTALTKLNNIMD